jgi:hypothetical protein
MLLTGAAASSLMIAVPASAAAPASAPLGAFRGSITSTVGSVTRTPTSNTTETITVGSSKATINWLPNNGSGSGNIVFLPKGNTATFVNAPNVSDYTVLNRIIPNNPNRKIELNGHVITQLRSESGTAVGGNVWFYSPGGIILGASAVFDVGGLLLTVNDVGADWAAGPNGFSASFSTAPGKMTEVDNRGGQINALGENSYVAIVGPSVEQFGTVNVNGSVAYVAAEQLTMTLNRGLFDIQVSVGSVQTDGILHPGTTTGPASSGALDPHQIYMVAVPKNQAMTMLLSGDIGFAQASSASVDNGQIVLCAGSCGGSSAAGTGTVNIDLAGGHFTSSVEAYGIGLIEAIGGAEVVFDEDVALESEQAISIGDLSAGASLSLTSGGDIHTGNLSAGESVAVDAAGSLTTANVSAATTIDLAAGGTANFLGLVAAPTITVTSGDINIAAGASLGKAGLTDLLTLNALSSGEPVVLGDVGQAQALLAESDSSNGGYHLAEAGEINAETLVVNAVAAGDGGAPDILVGDMQVDGSQAGGISHVKLNTGGSVLVEGAFLFNNAAATDTLGITAGEGIQVNTSAGGQIMMAGSNGAPSGVLELNAANIWVGDQGLLDKLAADPNFGGRDDALATNNGQLNAAGNLKAGGMVLSVGKSLFVQNSGTDDQFAGITVGGGGLTVRSVSQTPATVVAYGRKINADGTVRFNTDFFEDIDFDETGGGYTDGSTVNGCDLSQGCRPTALVPWEFLLGPVDDEVDPDGAAFLLLDLIDSPDFTSEVLVDEPVTSGNDIWQLTNDEDDDEEDEETP